MFYSVQRVESETLNQLASDKVQETKKTFLFKCLLPLYVIPDWLTDVAIGALWGGHTTCCWTPPYSFYIFKVAVSLCKVHSRPVKRFSGSASLTCEENSGRDRNVQMHFTLFQVLAGITRLPHCCVTLALPLCLPIMSYYKLQRPEFNKDNLTPTYNRRHSPIPKRKRYARSRWQWCHPKTYCVGCRVPAA